jgi:hypothetical protein
MPYSTPKFNGRLKKTCRLHIQVRKISRAGNQSESWWKARLRLPPAFTLISCLTHSSTGIYRLHNFSETSVDFQQATGRYIIGDRTL